MLGLSSDKLYKIEAESKSTSDHLHKVFDCWLKKDYDYKSHGIPTLRKLCNCIESESGGADPAIANAIAKEYPFHPKFKESQDTATSKGKQTLYVTEFYIYDFRIYSHC